MAVVGGGPAGMLLSEMVHRHGVESVVLQTHSCAHVLSRIRAGILEPTTVDALRDRGLAGRLDREGQPQGAGLVYIAALAPDAAHIHCLGPLPAKRVAAGCT